MLNSKKLLLDDYLFMLEQNGTPFDEIAILAFAQNVSLSHSNSYGWEILVHKQKPGL